MVAGGVEEEARFGESQRQRRRSPLRPRGEGRRRTAVEEEEEVVAVRPPQ